MFTGLIECTGKVVAVRRNGESAVLEVCAPLPESEITLGDSIAVNGACLTVTSKNSGSFAFDVSPETVDRTAMHSLKPGSVVNLERALKMGSRLDGHLVTGHIDCVGRLSSQVRRGNAVVMAFDLPDEHAAMLVEKGSVAIDGISLTVNSVERSSFTVAIIPTTIAKTTLGGIKVGAEVNIETDIIGKYVARLVAPHRKSGGLTMETLMKNGFM